jgi:hypothetical protein
VGRKEERRNNRSEDERTISLPGSVPAIDLPIEFDKRKYEHIFFTLLVSSPPPIRVRETHLNAQSLTDDE